MTHSPMTVSFRLHLIAMAYADFRWLQSPTALGHLRERVRKVFKDDLPMLTEWEEEALATILYEITEKQCGA